MFRKTSRHLFLSFYLSTSLLFTLSIIIMFLMSVSQAKDADNELFLSLVNPVIRTFMKDGLDAGAVSDYEQANKMLIYDNSLSEPAHENSLRVQLKSRLDAASEVSTGSIQVSGPGKDNSRIVLNVSETLTLADDSGTSYYGITCTDANDSSRTLGIISPIQYTVFFPVKRLLFFLFLEMAGLFLLAFISRTMAKKVLKPVIANQQRQDDFLSAASHELKTPVSVIQASANALAISSPEQASVLRNNIINECDRLDSLVKDLLLLVTSDSKTWTIQKQMISVEELISEIYSLFAPLCSETKHRLTLSLPERELGTIRIDKSRILQVFSILIDNAVSYSPADTEITLGIAVNRSFLLFSVIDHGTGIPDNEKKLVKNRFYRRDTSRTDKSHFGLGLSIAEEILAAHGSHLDFTDTMPSGCTVCFRLPNI